MRKLEKDEILNFGNKRLHTNKAQMEEARRMKMYIDIPYKDILHALIARDNEAILIYTDKHFEKLRFLIEIKKPEELIQVNT